MATNARIEDLRRRLDREPGSRLFAQLAEELRKAGELDEAIRVARDGLGRHPNYPSARMTLGRALFDLGDLRAARDELQAVVAAAPDNILACRLLGEALEGLGQREEAAARYRAVLALAPGDRAIAERVVALTERLPAEAAPAAMPSVPPADEAPPEPEPAHVAPAALDIETPIPLATVDEEDFELERPSETTARLMAIESPVSRPFDPADWAVPQETSAAPERPATAEHDGEIGAGRGELVFDFGAPAEAPAPTLPFQRVSDGAAAPTPEPVFVEEELEPAEPLSAPDAVPALSSPTLGELYFSQGVPQKAAAVYRQILEREPWNERARDRLHEIETLLAGVAARALVSVEGERPVATRREALERTIARLEAFLLAVREGRHTWPASPRP